jgi:hypothetical protein
VYYKKKLKIFVKLQDLNYRDFKFSLVLGSFWNEILKKVRPILETGPGST